MALSNKNKHFPYKKIIHTHYLKFVSICLHQLQCTFSCCYSSQTFFRLVSLSHGSGGIMLGGKAEIACMQLQLTTSLPFAFHPTGVGRFYPWKSFPLI